MKKIFSVVLLLLLTNCQNNVSNKIKIGINAEYPPYEYVEGDQLVGFNIDVVNDVMKNGNFEYEYINMGFDGLLSALQSKKVDLVIGVSPTPDRRKMVDYTILYSPETGEGHSLMIHTDSAIDTDNLQGKSIGVLLGSMQETILKSIEGVDIRLYNNYTGALLDLNNKKIDGVMSSKKPAQEYLSQNPNLKLAGAVDTISGGGYAVALNKGQEELKGKLNIEIQKLLDSGIVDQYRKKYKLDEDL